MSNILENFRASRTVNPKTFLAFYATVLGLLLLGASTLCGVLAWSRVQTWLIPWLLVFVGCVAIFLIVGIFVVMLISPAKVMLTQVTATEFVEIQRATLGDSRSGKGSAALTTAHYLEVAVAEPDDSGEITSDDSQSTEGSKNG